MSFTLELLISLDLASPSSIISGLGVYCFVVCSLPCFCFFSQSCEPFLGLRGQPCSQGLGVCFFGIIQKRICDLRSFRSWSIKGTDESTLDKDSSVPLLHHDPNDLRTQIRFWILPQKRTLGETLGTRLLCGATLFWVFLMWTAKHYFIAWGLPLCMNISELCNASIKRVYTHSWINQLERLQNLDNEGTSKTKTKQTVAFSSHTCNVRFSLNVNRHVVLVVWISFQQFLHFFLTMNYWFF